MNSKILVLTRITVDENVAGVLQFTGSSELSAMSVDCPTPSTHLRVPIKLATITGDVQLVARIELTVGSSSVTLDRFCPTPI